MWYNYGVFSYSDIFEYFPSNPDKTRIRKVHHTLDTRSSSVETYSYYPNGNIKEYWDMTGSVISYEYDDLNRLVRENNSTLGFTKTYTYNEGKVKIYPYTPLGSAVSANPDVWTYSSDSSGRLSGVSNGSQSLGEIGSYDFLGNPCIYKGNTLQWKGKQLQSYGNVSYKYDAGGTRVEKQVGTVTHKYYTEGSTIHKETRGSSSLWYYYDESGIRSIEYNGAVYICCKNLQGDVVQLLNTSGTVAAVYVYDAWGFCKTLNPDGTPNTSSSFIGNINPFRYRGYYYDVETNLYYLQSRYYDPSIGRFINADSIDNADPSAFTGLDLYAYCLNNPVIYYDPSGEEPITFAILGICALISFFAVSTVVVVETQFHPIENTMKLIGQGVDYLINDVDWQGIGSSIGGFFTDTWNDLWNMGRQGKSGPDSDFAKRFPKTPTGNEKLGEELEKAYKAGDIALVRRIQTELEYRKKRNKKKQRSPKMRGLWWLLLSETIRRIFELNEN